MLLDFFFLGGGVAINHKDDELSFLIYNDNVSQMCHTRFLKKKKKDFLI